MKNGNPNRPRQINMIRYLPFFPSTAGEGVQLKELESLKNLPLSDVKPARKFSVEHPFLFFILDRLDNLVVVAGKVTDPQQPTPFEI